MLQSGVLQPSNPSVVAFYSEIYSERHTLVNKPPSILLMDATITIRPAKKTEHVERNGDGRE